MIDDLFFKEVFSAIALMLTLVAFAPYMISIWRQETRPHVFSWFIWGAGTVVVCVTQLSDGAGIASERTLHLKQSSR